MIFFKTRIKMKKLLFFMPFLLIVWSCNEKTEGCLDPEASNFDPSADLSCCCEYPQLEVLFSYDNYGTDSSAFGLNEVHNDVANNPYLVLELAIYLTDFELIKVDDSIVRVADTLHVNLRNGNALELIDDILLVKPNTFQYEIGRMENSGNYKQLRFKVGLGNPASETNPNSVAAEHPLGTNGLFRTSASEYAMYEMSIVKDTANLQNQFIYETIAPAYQIDLDYNFTIQAGFNTRLRVNADLKEIFNNIDFQNETEEQINMKIYQNIGNIFSVGG